MTDTDSVAISSAKTKPVRGISYYANRTWLRVALLIVCGTIARYPALQGQLIWDDDYLVGGNPMIRSPLLIVECFRHFLFLDSFATHYRPVQNVSYCLDYLIWGNDAVGYHIANVLWHVTGGVLLFFLLRRLFDALSLRFAHTRVNERTWSTTAFVVALVWIVHPVHSAAVDYISGRADSLACVFASGGWILFLRGGESTQRWKRVLLYSSAGLLTFLAFCSRESAFMWALVFLLYLFSFESRIGLRRKLATLAAIGVIIGFYVVLRHLPAEHSAPTSDGGSTPFIARLVLMLRALGDYGRIMVWPSMLHMDRTVESPGLLLGNAGWRASIATEYLSLLGGLVAMLLAVGALCRGRARAIRAFGACWFVLAFLPISNLIELNATVAEHWLYLPSIGLLIFATGCTLELSPRVRQIAVGLACIATVGLSARSIVRSGDWLSPETMYRSALRTGAAKPRIALNLGVALTGKGDYKAAEPLLRRVVTLFPDYPIAVNALAHVLLRQGKTEEANHYFALANEIGERTRNEYPRTWIAALNVAHMHVRDHDLPGALAVAEKARNEYPNTWELISFESEALRKLKGPTEALAVIEPFAKANWWHAGAAIAEGKLYFELGRYADAEAAFRHASRLDVHGVEALNMIALLYVNENQLDAALTVQRQALARQPDHPRQHLLLSDIFTRMGRTADAKAALAHVSELKAEVETETLPN